MSSNPDNKAAAKGGAQPKKGVQSDDMIQRLLKSGPVGRIELAIKPRIKELKFSLHLMSKSATSITGIILIILLVILAAFPFFFAKPDVGARDPFIIPKDFRIPLPQAPGADFPLGSMENGASIYYGIVWGSRISMAFAIQVVIVGVIMGTILGLVAGYKGGVIDEIIMRLTDIFLSIPSLILIMAVAAALGRGLGATKLALIAVWWSGYTRLIRGQVLSIRENSYIDAARASGSGDLKIMFRHILPNSWSPVVVQATMDMGSVVLVLAGLGFLGLGAPSGYAEWGIMVAEGQAFVVVGYWWMVVFPGLAILMFVLAFNLMGDGLRDVLDPKMRR
jgi:peptide/nickel transport system permease protein